MNKIQEQINRFKILYPEYKDKELDLNLYCDILEDGKVIAVSDLPHDITALNNRLATNWKVVK